MKKINQYLQARLGSSISPRKELTSIRVCWIGKEEEQGVRFPLLQPWPTGSALEPEIARKCAVYPRNTKNGRGMAQSSPFPKYFHYVCSLCNRKKNKEKKKKREKELFSLQFQLACRKMRLKKYKKPLHVKQAVMKEQKRGLSPGCMFTYPVKLRQPTIANFN